MTRKIVLVANHVKMADEDRLDVLFWRSKPAFERLQVVVRLRRKYFTNSNGAFPEKIEKVVFKKQYCI